ncbi:hypothetical protein E2C01_019944 [Portunus trituberculatus]|uniref:Uncharacterized protein n=1 Tax=Portunus trituberculatus TaxID=210409 RepID=A0A5B7E1T1_PORTR|nr:hypothetical protein [Portunus trituberculatus]
MKSDTRQRLEMLSHVTYHVGLAVLVGYSTVHHVVVHTKACGWPLFSRRVVAASSYLARHCSEALSGWLSSANLPGSPIRTREPLRATRKRSFSITVIT